VRRREERRERGGRCDHVVEDVNRLFSNQESESTGDDDNEESHESDEEHSLREQLSGDIRGSGNRGIPMEDSRSTEVRFRAHRGERGEVREGDNEPDEIGEAEDASEVVTV
jgi:hypothetical protein